jgi:hypothetical protein
MKRLLLFVALTVVVAGGCKKYTSSSDDTSGSSGGGGGSGFGAEQAVRGAVQRTVTMAELHDLHLFMNNAKLSLGRVPTKQETWEALNRPDGNRQLVKLIQDGTLILVPQPQDEGLWAYSKEAPTLGGIVLTHDGAERVTANEFLNRFGRQQ